MLAFAFLSFCLGYAYILHGLPLSISRNTFGRSFGYEEKRRRFVLLLFLSLFGTHIVLLHVAFSSFFLRVSVSSCGSTIDSVHLLTTNFDCFLVFF